MRKSDKISIIVLVVVVLIFGFNYLFKPEGIVGISMYPTINNDSYVLLNKTVLSPPKYEDIVVFSIPSDPNVRYIKRVVAVEGDSLKLIGNHLYRNGELIVEDYINEIEDRYSYRERELIIPSGHVYLLGDNREYSLDSRDLGPIPSYSIQGIVKYSFPSYKEFYKIKRLK